MTAATGSPGGVDPVYARATGTVDDATRIATRRERIAAMLQRSGAFLILGAVTVIASLVFGTRFASVDNFLNTEGVEGDRVRLHASELPGVVHA